LLTDAAPALREVEIVFVPADGVGVPFDAELTVGLNADKQGARRA